MKVSVGVGGRILNWAWADGVEMGMQSWQGVQGSGKSMICVGPRGAKLNERGMLEGKSVLGLHLPS